MVYIHTFDFSVLNGKIPYLNACTAVSDDTYQPSARTSQSLHKTLPLRLQVERWVGARPTEFYLIFLALHFRKIPPT